MSIDLLGSAGRIKVLSSVLVSLQEQEYNLALMQVANDADDHETVPGENFTYGKRLEDLRLSQKRLFDSADAEVVSGLRRLTDGK
jgi:hypothetical protein